MKIKEFVDGYNKIVIDKMKNSYLTEKLNTKQYIDFSDKCKIAERVAKSTMFVYEDGKQTTEIRTDSVGRYVLSTLSIIENYTDLEIDFANVMEEYNLLAKSNILPLIFGEGETEGLIPGREISEIQTLIAMSVDDIVQNNFTTHAFIQNQVTRFGQLCGFTLKPVVEKLTTAIENLDDKTIEKLMKQLDRRIK